MDMKEVVMQDIMRLDCLGDVEILYIILDVGIFKPVEGFLKIDL